jgi:hypothetical protein
MLSWKEDVALTFIKLLYDPELVIYFMKILFSLRECFREDLEVNRYLPIASYLQLSNFRETIYHIKYFTPGFIRRVEGFVHGEPQYVDDFISDKVDVVETLLLYENCDTNIPIEGINQALQELHDLEEIYTPEDELWLNIPYLTYHMWIDRFGEKYKYIELIN